MKPDPAKVATLDQWAPPMKHIETLTQHDVSAATLACAKKQIVHECRRFLGFMNYFHRFIPQFAAVAEKLYEQTKMMRLCGLMSALKHGSCCVQHLAKQQ